MAQRRLTRDQIAKIVNNDPEAIRAFEDLFRQATADQPAELVTLRRDLDGLAQAPDGFDALEALSWASRIQDRLDRFAYAEIVKTADPTRMVNANSGVNCCKSRGDSGAGDIYDDHTYVGPGRPAHPPSGLRLAGRGVAVDGRARLGDQPEPVGGDPPAEPDGDVPHRTRVPARPPRGAVTR